MIFLKILKKTVFTKVFVFAMMEGYIKLCFNLLFQVAESTLRTLLTAMPGGYTRRRSSIPSSITRSPWLDGGLIQVLVRSTGSGGTPGEPTGGSTGSSGLPCIKIILGLRRIVFGQLRE